MKRRMISTDIISEGRFLRMSMTAQALYMHLLANADDDGVVDCFTIMRMVGAQEDDLNLLVEREYIIVLDKRELILWITHWQEFNKIPSHIKENSKYLALLREKVPDILIVESTKAADNQRRYVQLKEYRQNKNHDPNRILIGSSPDHGHDPSSRLGKVRLGEDRNNTVTDTNTYVAEATEDIQKMKDSWKENAGTTLRNHLEGNLIAYNYLVKEVGDELPFYLQAVCLIRSDTYQKRTLQAKLINYVGLREKLEEVEAYMAGKVYTNLANQPV